MNNRYGIIITTTITNCMLLCFHIRFSTSGILCSYRRVRTVRGEMCGFPLTRSVHTTHIVTAVLSSAPLLPINDHHRSPVKRVTRSPQRNLTHNSHIHTHYTHNNPMLPMCTVRLYTQHTQVYISYIHSS